MKKITLSIGLVAAILSANAQDTSCTYFKGKKVYDKRENIKEKDQKRDMDRIKKMS